MIDRIPSAVEVANAAKIARLSLPVRDDWYAKAWRRVQGSPRLGKYEDIVLADYGGGDDDYRWVAEAKVSEIVAWAETIRRDSYADG